MANKMAKNGKKLDDYERGANLEQMFAEHVVTELGYDNYVTRKQVKSANNSRGTNVDVIGHRLDERGRRLEKFGKVCLAICIGFGILGLLWLIYGVNKWDGVGLLVFAVIFEVSAAVVIGLSKKLAFENIWCECKNLKGKATISQVRKAIDELNDYRNSGDTTYKFVEAAFVSVNGFVENALELAKKNNVKCYVVENDKFKRITNWN